MLPPSVLYFIFYLLPSEAHEGFSLSAEEVTSNYLTAAKKSDTAYTSEDLDLSLTLGTSSYKQNTPRIKPQTNEAELGIGVGEVESKMIRSEPRTDNIAFSPQQPSVHHSMQLSNALASHGTVTVSPYLWIHRESAGSMVQQFSNEFLPIGVESGLEITQNACYNPEVSVQCVGEGQNSPASRKRMRGKENQSDEDWSENGIPRRCFQCNTDQTLFRGNGLQFMIEPRARRKRVRTGIEGYAASEVDFGLVDVRKSNRKDADEKEFPLSPKTGAKSEATNYIPFLFVHEHTKLYFNNIQYELYGIRNEFQGTACGLKFFKHPDYRRRMLLWNRGIEKGEGELEILKLSNTCDSCHLPEILPSNRKELKPIHPGEYLILVKNQLVHCLPVILYDIKIICQAFPGIPIEAQMSVQEVQKEAWKFYSYLWYHMDDIFFQHKKIQEWKETSVMNHEVLIRTIQGIKQQALEGTSPKGMITISRKFLVLWLSVKCRSLYMRIFNQPDGKVATSFVSILNEFHAAE